MNSSTKTHLLIEVHAGQVISPSPSNSKLPQLSQGQMGWWGPRLPLAKGNAQWTGQGDAWERVPQNTKSEMEIASWGTTFDFCF